MCVIRGDSLDSGDRHAAAELNRAFINQSAEALRDSFFGSIELILLAGHPRHFAIGDDAAGHGLQKQFSKRHGIAAVGNTLMAVPEGCMTCSPFFMAVDDLKRQIDLIVEIGAGIIQANQVCEPL